VDKVLFGAGYPKKSGVQGMGTVYCACTVSIGAKEKKMEEAVEAIS
jgi:hypothetical protein